MRTGLPVPSGRNAGSRAQLCANRRTVTPMLLLLLLLSVPPTSAHAQEQPTPASTPAADIQTQSPDTIDVLPEARDEQIRERLQSILEATGWFTGPQVQVRDGVVFLHGRTEREDFRTWAGDVARRIQDVVAVVNQVEVVEPSVWTLEPALAGLRDLWRRLLRAVPLIAFALLVLAVAAGLARLAVAGTHAFLRPRLDKPLLRSVAARGVGLAVLLFGLYVVFHVAGLTSLALTILGGTGVLGLVLGIAFRDITENFLASIFLSLQSPFRAGDLIEIAGTVGFVQRLTTRVTVLMTPDGDHVQIPNATVFKGTIRNYSSNPNRREDFTIGIGYFDSIAEAQEIALGVLAEHPAVLAEPEPWVLVDSLGSATVVLRVYFWLDGTRHNWLTVRSSVIRLVKRAFQSAGISMPDEARELVFPEGVPVQILPSKELRREVSEQRHAEESLATEESTAISTAAEGGLRSDAQGIKAQADRSRSPEEGENLLEPPPSK